MNRNNSGFTLIEIVVVMVLISIIAAAVFTRSITTNQINFTGQAEKIKNHIRYAQSVAMKRDEFWGVYSDGDYYWLFQWEGFGDETNNKKVFPGEEVDTIDLGNVFLRTDPFTVIFYGSLGKPYRSMFPLIPVTTSNGVDVNIYSDDSSLSLLLKISPETGLLVDQ
jgi:prepilin-type N-terminal cleavage/methylation domain-containing protein